MNQLVLIVHVLACVFLIVLVLIQRGKGADIGAAFGSGASQTVFGSSGSGSFLMKLTCAIGAIFFATSLILGYIAAHRAAPTSKMDSFISAPAGQTTHDAPATLNQAATANKANDTAKTPAGKQTNTGK